ncbi:hypothetical protein [Kitasatospora cineracea]|uniref:Uncharacterized protein n=1 Tax=Kitasatospora cineracea TaxID=88074 RepID=A0A3N4RBU2_9ACTN|nr:hypothetical protein [Kitasatospora cineracea]ROR37741.1 hypothetical protein EDD39_5895 [Kitasatospora cineracea]RPE28839.1 hypothetical protein EDD38_5983 [Kitasatospora cineracea]
MSGRDGGAGAGRDGYASATLPRHLLRGAVGFGAVAAGFGLLPVFGPVVLLAVPIGLVALRGCPLCWTVGLLQLLSRGRLRRTCRDGRCTLERGSRGRAAG